MPLAEFDTVAAARTGFKELIDAAHSGGAGLVRRSGETYAVIPVDLIRTSLLPTLGTTPEVLREGDGVGLVLPGMPFATEGNTLEEAATDMVDALREYAEDWPRLRHAANHRAMTTLVPFVDLSTDEQLVDWLTGRA